ncbi:RNA polymerase sigma factor [Roseimaritima ulvae]|uniref:RNA polymerase sigma factor RpoE n=1 Tax=Roseimaritima ulvae TaxID=980254 RepID=A0A5B9QQR8_9BACT|nr:sigma-70 family RNA polymerase sigma factor [Roseimaritima ulvae]QEG39376.1 RNA polymerase sigma factor RpoE [Roseimaritima ulvae]
MRECATPDPDPFATTQWTIVLNAVDSSESVRQAALEDLCQRYWMPLYVYLRRRGHQEHAAQDLVQGFFAQLLEKNFLNSIDATKGKFRAFMLVAIKNFAANEHAKANAVKRGGHLDTLPIDYNSGESWYRQEPSDQLTAERLFERRWALSVMDTVMQRLRERFVEQDRVGAFEILEPHLLREQQRMPYAEAAAQLQCSVASLKSTMYRMRKWYRELLLDEISQTVDQKEVMDELGQLLAVISGEFGQ